MTFPLSSFPSPLITSHLIQGMRSEGRNNREPVHRATSPQCDHLITTASIYVHLYLWSSYLQWTTLRIKKMPSESLSNQKPQSSCELEDQFMMILIPSIAHSFASTLALIILPVAALVLPKSQHSPSHKLQLTLIILLQLHWHIINFWYRDGNQPWTK